MTLKTDTIRKPKRHRHSAAEAEALRLLAREAALRGESLASIRARLRIPHSTLTVWARTDGYRQSDLAARADATAARDEAAAVAAICEQADEMWKLFGEMSDRARSPAQTQVDLARVRTLALTEAGFLDAAEAEIAAVRRLARLLSFGRADSSEMEQLQRRAFAETQRLALNSICRYLAREKRKDEAAAAAREAAGLPPPPPPPETPPPSKEQVDAILADIRERARNRDPWAELVRLRKEERGGGEGEEV
jgi:hypothetical protein